MNLSGYSGGVATRAQLHQINQFDEIIDVRTPLEFADDHIPGAINAPVLSNEERVRVGTLYKADPFAATRLGASLVARNIGHHLEHLFHDRPKSWSPLIYCWRGGKRSGSMAAWFNLVGWPAQALEGGYKTYRNHVLNLLDALPASFTYIVLTGPTGTGKTRLLDALRHCGAQVLDLEGLAKHRGSLLGRLPGHEQPPQKMFESLLARDLQALNSQQPVFVEAESPRIGKCVLPKPLLHAMYQGRCVRINASLDARLAFLLDDYQHLFQNPDAFKETLSRFAKLHSRQTVQHWHELVDQNAREQLFRELMTLHYDPAYARSSGSHFANLGQALDFNFRPHDADTREQAAGLISALNLPIAHTTAQKQALP
jgi:tRNA 2-selenouridine synthase